MGNPPGNDALLVLAHLSLPVSSVLEPSGGRMISASSFIRCCTCLQAPLLAVHTIHSCTASCQSARRGGRGGACFRPLMSTTRF